MSWLRKLRALWGQRPSHERLWSTDMHLTGKNTGVKTKKYRLDDQSRKSQEHDTGHCLDKCVHCLGLCVARRLAACIVVRAQDHCSWGGEGVCVGGGFLDPIPMCVCGFLPCQQFSDNSRAWCCLPPDSIRCHRLRVWSCKQLSLHFRHQLTPVLLTDWL